MELLGNCLHSLFAPTHPSTYLGLTSSSAATPHDSAKVTSDQQSRNSISCFHLTLASVGSDTLVSCQPRPLSASTIPSYLPASLPFPLLACSFSQLHVGVSQHSKYLMTSKCSYHRTLDRSCPGCLHLMFPQPGMLTFARLILTFRSDFFPSNTPSKKPFLPTILKSGHFLSSHPALGFFIVCAAI